MKKVKNNIVNCPECNSKANRYNLTQNILAVVSVALIVSIPIFTFSIILMPLAAVALFVAPITIILAIVLPKLGHGHRIKCESCKNTFTLSKQEYKELN